MAVDRIELNGEDPIDPSRVFDEIDRFAGFRRAALRAVASISEENFAKSMTDKWEAIKRGNVIEGAESSGIGRRLVITQRKTGLVEDGSKMHVDVKLVFDENEAEELERITASEIKFIKVNSLPRVLDTRIAWVTFRNGRLDADRTLIPNSFKGKQSV